MTRFWTSWRPWASCNGIRRGQIRRCTGWAGRSLRNSPSPSRPATCGSPKRNPIRSETNASWRMPACCCWDRPKSLRVSTFAQWCNQWPPQARGYVHLLVCLLCFLDSSFNLLIKWQISVFEIQITSTVLLTIDTSKTCSLCHSSSLGPLAIFWRVHEVLQQHSLFGQASQSYLTPKQKSVLFYICADACIHLFATTKFFFFAGLVWQQALSKTTVNPEHACSACVYFFAASGEDQAWRRWGGGDWLWLRIMNKGAAQARSGCLVAWGWTLFSQKDEFHMHPLMDFAATGQRHPLWNIIWESSIIFWVDRPEHQDLLINRQIAAGRSIRERQSYKRYNSRLIDGWLDS